MFHHYFVSLRFAVLLSLHLHRLFFMFFSLLLNLDLVRALKKVKSWYPLGLCLGIPMEELQELRSKRISAKKCAQKVLLAWMEREVTSWATLVRALNEVRATDLAYKIASKYSKLNIAVNTGTLILLSNICAAIIDVPLADLPGRGVSSTDSLRKPRSELIFTQSVVTINAERQSVSFRAGNDEFIPECKDAQRHF